MTISSADYAALMASKQAGAPTRKPPTRKEREIQRAILDYLATRRDVVAWRQNTGAMKVGDRFVRFGVKGLPDIVGWVTMPTRHHYCENVEHIGARDLEKPSPFVEPHRHYHIVLRARPLLIEVKKPGEFPTRDQQAILDKLKSDGGIAIVANSVEDVRNALKGD